MMKTKKNLLFDQISINSRTIKKNNLFIALKLGNTEIIPENKLENSLSENRFFNFNDLCVCGKQSIFMV